MLFFPALDLLNGSTQAAHDRISLLAVTTPEEIEVIEHVIQIVELCPQFMPLR